MLEISEALAIIRKNYESLLRRWQDSMRQLGGNRLAARSIAKLQTIPGPPVYPIDWTSERQRKAFFASDGFGRGIPTKRTGQIVAEWEGSFEETETGGLLLLQNWNPAVQFLQGVNVQQFHLNTGWVQIDDVADDAHAEMSEVAVLTFYQVGDPLEGIA
jgi:hypothetical protein